MASVGDYLRDLRDRRGISLEEISRVTRVASGYLEALESDRFSALPPPPSARAPPATARVPAVSPTPPGPGVVRPTPAAPPVPAVTAEAARASSPPPWLGDVQAATGGVASPYRLVARVSEPTWIRVR